MRHLQWCERTLCLCIAALTLGGESARATSVSWHPGDGDPVDLWMWGHGWKEGNASCVQWNNPREVSRIVVYGSDLKPADLRVEWWGSVWPNNGTGGWMKLDDHWNGQWVTIPTEGKASDNGVTFTFPPLSKAEWKAALDKYDSGSPPTYRKTLKIRVINTKSPASAVRFGVFGASNWKNSEFTIETRLREAAAGGSLQVTNGLLYDLTALPSSVTPDLDGHAWTASGDPKQSVRLRVKVHYTVNEDKDSNDLTRVTVRLGTGIDASGFSFVPQDVLKAGALRIPSLGALVTPGDSPLTLDNDKGPGDAFWARTVRERIRDMPEMSRETAMQNIPRLTPARWVPLGVPSGRQEVLISGAGDWAFDPTSLWTEGSDSQRMGLRGKGTLYCMLDTRPEPRFKEAKGDNLRRYLEDGHLPLIHVEWDQDGVHYHHQLAATVLLGDISEDEKRRGDEAVALLTKLEITNPGDKPAPARLWLRFSDPTPVSLSPEGVIELQPADRTRIPKDLVATRGIISMGKPAGGKATGWKVEPGTDPKASHVLSWSETLEPGAKRVVYFKAAYIDLLTADEFQSMQRIAFDERVPHDLAYWKKRLDADMQLNVPEPELVNFYKANLWHNVITCDRDPKTGLYNEGVGTYNYKVFANETVMIARSMDMRGEHTEAERYLEPMLHFQGAEGLTGRFTTKDGVFHSAGAYTHGQYAMNHGFVLWGVAEHYFFTHDRKYLERVAPKLIKGCDFLIQQRQATMNAPAYPSTAPADGMVKSHDVHGLAPASSLEDVIEFKYWFPTNAYFHLGMKRVAQALADIGHPEAERIAREAESYRRDIERAAREAATQSAVAPRRNGTYAPFAPSRVHQWRHLTEGWIREALYCNIDLAVGEVITHEDPIVTWVLDELEDNTFFSAESGYNVPDVEKNWFGLGGVTLQPCLMDLPRLYMLRNENEASLRAFWNAYALLIYPDTQCFAEWAKAFGRGGGPVYKTADEARFCIWFRQFLVNEQGDTLWLALGTPRAWLADGKTIDVRRAATHFGEISLKIQSEVAKGRILAEVDLPRIAVPKETWLRLRHPEGKLPQQIAIDGTPAPADQIKGDAVRLPAQATGKISVVATYE